jgi:hypothetical protein
MQSRLIPPRVDLAAHRDRRNPLYLGPPFPFVGAFSISKRNMACLRGVGSWLPFLGGRLFDEGLIKPLAEYTV